MSKTALAVVPAVAPALALAPALVADLALTPVVAAAAARPLPSGLSRPLPQQPPQQQLSAICGVSLGPNKIGGVQCSKPMNRLPSWRQVPTALVWALTVGQWDYRGFEPQLTIIP